MEKLGLLDVSVFIAYFVFVTFIGFFAGRKKKDSARDYFVTSSRLTWYLIGFSMIASSISTENMVGSAGFTYKWGLPVLNWELVNVPSMIILIWIFLPIYLNKRITTMPQFLERRFSSATGSLYAVISIATGVFIILAGVIYTGGYLLEQIFGLPKIYGIWLTSIVAGSYTVYGGLVSVVWAQVLQAVLLLGSGVLISILGIIHVPGGFSEILLPAAHPERCHLVMPLNHPELPWTAMVAMAFPVNIWYWCSSQHLNQSCLGARSRWDGKMGIIFCGFLILLTTMSIEFPGLIAYAINPNLEDVNAAFPFVVNQLVFTGLKGLVLAGLCGAVMSTVQALIHANSTIFTLDLFKKLKKNISEKGLIRAGQICSVIVLILGALWAPMVERFDTIFEFFQKCWFFIAMPVATVFILAVGWKRATPTAALWTLMLCFPLFVLPYILRVGEQNYGWQVVEFNLAGIVFIIAFIFMVVVSLFTKPPKPEQVNGIVWKPSLIKPQKEDLGSDYRWYKNLWLWGTIWVAIFTAIYIRLR